MFLIVTLKNFNETMVTLKALPYLKIKWLWIM